MAVKPSSPARAGTRPARQGGGSRAGALLLSGFGVLLIAACAVLLSYSGIYRIALQGNVDESYAHLYPGVFTLLLLLAFWASFVLRSAPRVHRLQIDGVILLLIALAAGASVLAAREQRLIEGVAQVIAAVAPWLALLLAFLMFVRVWRHLHGELPDPRRRPSRPRADRADPRSDADTRPDLPAGTGPVDTGLADAGQDVERNPDAPTITLPTGAALPAPTPPDAGSGTESGADHSVEEPEADRPKGPTLLWPRADGARGPRREAEPETEPGPTVRVLHASELPPRVEDPEEGAEAPDGRSDAAAAAPRGEPDGPADESHRAPEADEVPPAAEALPELVEAPPRPEETSPGTAPGPAEAAPAAEPDGTDSTAPPETAETARSTESAPAAEPAAERDPEEAAAPPADGEGPSDRRAPAITAPTVPIRAFFTDTGTDAEAGTGTGADTDGAELGGAESGAESAPGAAPLPRRDPESGGNAIRRAAEAVARPESPAPAVARPVPVPTSGDDGFVHMAGEDDPTSDEASAAAPDSGLAAPDVSTRVQALAPGAEPMSKRPMVLKPRRSPMPGFRRAPDAPPNSRVRSGPTPPDTPESDETD